MKSRRKSSAAVIDSLLAVFGAEPGGSPAPWDLSVEVDPFDSGVETCVLMTRVSFFDDDGGALWLPFAVGAGFVVADDESIGFGASKTPGNITLITLSFSGSKPCLSLIFLSSSSAGNLFMSTSQSTCFCCCRPSLLTAASLNRCTDSKC
jgi:hypothetical protein